MAAIVKSSHAVKNNEVKFKFSKKISKVNFQEFLLEISTKVSSCLASYAIPVFIRITHNVDKTGKIFIIITCIFQETPTFIFKKRF